MFYKFGFRNLKHDLLMNILIILQMTFSFVIVISMISTIVSRFELYNPLKKQLNSKGYFYFADDAPLNIKDYKLKSTLEKYLSKESNIFCTYELYLSPENSEHDGAIRMAYEEEFIKSYTPRLADGDWSAMSKTPENSVVPVAVFGDYKVGDRITFGNNTVTPLEAEVVAVIEDGATVFGYPTTVTSNLAEDYSERDCRRAYIKHSFEIEERELFIFNIESLKKARKDLDLYEGFLGPIFVTYPPDTPDEIIENDKKIMYDSINVMNDIPLSEMKTESLEYIFSQIYTLFPILICVLILTITGAVSISALSAKRQLKNYAVFYVCGLKWKQCAFINMISMAICTIISFVLSIIVSIILRHTGILGENLIETGIPEILSCFVLVIIYNIMSLILPLNIIRKNTPNQILKTN